MMKFLIVPILVCPFLWACACAATDSCAEEWYKESLEEPPETCLDKEKYNTCMDYFNLSQTPTGFSVSGYCRNQATYRCADRKSSSSRFKF